MGERTGRTRGMPNGDFLPQGGAQTEWWYYAGHVRAAEREFAFHFSYFRRVARPMTVAGWIPSLFRHLRFAHFSLSDLASGHFYCAQRRVPGGFCGRATEGRDRLSLEIGPWGLRETEDGFSLRASMDRARADIRMVPSKPHVYHGERGHVRKGAESSSTHLSLPRLAATGTIELDGKRFEVTGQAWADREHGTFRLGPDFGGWEWLAIQLHDGTELMLYRLRNQSGSASGFGGATFIDDEGGVDHLPLGAFTSSPVRTWRSPSGIQYTVAWRITVPALELELDVAARLEHAEFDARPSSGILYWENVADVRGRVRGSEVTGTGFVEQVYPPPEGTRGVYDFGRENMSWADVMLCEKRLPDATRGWIIPTGKKRGH